MPILPAPPECVAFRREKAKWHIRKMICLTFYERNKTVTIVTGPHYLLDVMGLRDTISDYERLNKLKNKIYININIKNNSEYQNSHV